MVDNYLQELETARKEAENRTLQWNATGKDQPTGRNEKVYSRGQEEGSKNETGPAEHPQGKMTGAEQVSYQTLEKSAGYAGDRSAKPCS